MPFDEGVLRDILVDPDGVSFPANGDSPESPRNKVRTVCSCKSHISFISGATNWRYIQLGDTYNPDCLPDHRGPFFVHEASKLVQRDYKGINGELIAPHELYQELTEGTLTLHTYVWDGQPRNKVCSYSFLGSQN